jgi:hypothetical protein
LNDWVFPAKAPENTGKQRFDSHRTLHLSPFRKIAVYNPVQASAPVQLVWIASQCRNEFRLKRGLLGAAKCAKLHSVQCVQIVIRLSKRSPDLLDIKFRTIKLYDAEFLAKSFERAGQLLARMGNVNQRQARTTPDDLGFGSQPLQ